MEVLVRDMISDLTLFRSDSEQQIVRNQLILFVTIALSQNSLTANSRFD